MSAGVPSRVPETGKSEPRPSGPERNWESAPLRVLEHFARIVQDGPRTIGEDGIFKTVLAIGIAAAFFGFVTQPSIADDDADRDHKKSGSIVELLDAVVAGQQDVTINVTANDGVFEFVGFSSGTVDGSGDSTNPGSLEGISGMFKPCRDQFGSEARMCTSEEYFRLPNASRPTLAAWVHPAFAIEGRSDLGCRGTTRFWTGGLNGDTGGLVIDTDGNAAEFTCDALRPVTCCARVTQDP